MSTTYKIAAELCLEDFELIAVHSDMIDYALAYHLNQITGLRLKRNANDLCFEKGLRFSVFEWTDESNENNWMLVNNQCKVERQNYDTGLFKSAASVVSQQLIHEKKEVDFFIKIETDQTDLIQTTVELVNKIPNVITAYRIDPDTLRSKKNLIF